MIPAIGDVWRLKRSGQRHLSIRIHGEDGHKHFNGDPPNSTTEIFYSVSIGGIVDWTYGDIKESAIEIAPKWLSAIIREHVFGENGRGSSIRYMARSMIVTQI